MATIEKRVGKDGQTQYRVKLRLRGHKPASATFARLNEARSTMLWRITRLGTPMFTNWMVSTTLSMQLMRRGQKSLIVQPTVARGS